MDTHLQHLFVWQRLNTDTHVYMFAIKKSVVCCFIHDALGFTQLCGSLLQLQCEFYISNVTSNAGLKIFVFLKI